MVFSILCCRLNFRSFSQRSLSLQIEMSKKRNTSQLSSSASSIASKKVKSDENTFSTSHIANNTTFPETFPEWKPDLGDSHYKILSWNVSSLPACIKKGFHRYIESEDPDILCLQETKLNAPMHDLFPKTKTYPYRYFSIGDKKGYSGSLIFSKFPPSETHVGLIKDGNDDEGRVITLKFPKFHLINMYVPNAGENLKRLDFKVEWMKKALDHLNHLAKEVPIIICGDINVAHQPIDLARPKTNTKTAGFTVEERESFSKWLEQGYKDVWREFHPNEQNFTYYSYRFQCRQKRIGWRLDYFIASNELMDKVSECEIRDTCYGASDHVPLVLHVKKELLDSVS